MGRFPHLLQYTSKSLALWLQMPVDDKPSYGFGSLALFGRGLIGQLGYLEVTSSSGLGGIGIGDICLCDGDNHAPLMMAGHLVGE